jgi:hypothetical protein
MGKINPPSGKINPLKCPILTPSIRYYYEFNYLPTTARLRRSAAGRVAYG